MAKWCTIAPIHYSDIQKKIDLPYELGNSTCLVLKPDWLIEDAMTEYLDYSKRERLVEEDQYAIQVTYDADSYGEPDPDWKGKFPRSLQDKAVELINLSNIAIWLSNPCDFRYELIYNVYKNKEEEKWKFKSYHEYAGLSPDKKYMDYKLNMTDLSLAKNLFAVLTKLERSSTVWVAIRSLWRALTEDTWEVRFLLMCIVLEGLFGPEDAREITFRLSQRLSFYLFPDDKNDAKRLFTDIKKIYSWRSKVVHGMRLEKLSEEESDDTLCNAEQWARHSLVRTLGDPKLLSVFSNNKEREAYLDDIVYE